MDFSKVNLNNGKSSRAIKPSDNDDSEVDVNSQLPKSKASLRVPNLRLGNAPPVKEASESTSRIIEASKSDSKTNLRPHVVKRSIKLPIVTPVDSAVVTPVVVDSAESVSVDVIKSSQSPQPDNDDLQTGGVVEDPVSVREVLEGNDLAKSSEVDSVAPAVRAPRIAQRLNRVKQSDPTPVVDSSVVSTPVDKPSSPNAVKPSFSKFKTSPRNASDSTTSPYVNKAAPGGKFDSVSTEVVDGSNVVIDPVVDSSDSVVDSSLVTPVDFDEDSNNSFVKSNKLDSLDSDESDSFGDLLGDLFEDEEVLLDSDFVNSPIVTPVGLAGPSTPVVTPVEGVGDLHVKEVNSLLVKPVVKSPINSVAPIRVVDSKLGGVDSKVVLDRVVGNANRVIKVGEADQALIDERREDRLKISEAREKELLSKDSGALVGVQKGDSVRVRLKSESKNPVSREVVVDSTGKPLRGKVVDPVTPVEKSRYRYVAKDGKLNGAELEFFKNLGKSKGEVRANPSVLDNLRAPVNFDESEVERKERSARISRALDGRNAYKRGSNMRFNQKDREVLEFLAMFRYATYPQLSRMFSEAEGTTYNRLKKLRSQGLVIDKKIYGARPIWFLTEAGILLSGYDLPRVTEAKLTYSMFPHQFTVNNTAANLWGANLNVLDQSDYPVKNRPDGKGSRAYGESLVSELEIQSSFGKMKMFDKSDVYRPQLLGNIDREFRVWEEAGGPSFGSSPEMSFGNEYMWSLMPPFNLRLAYHVPDLVIKRDRNADGSPNSIAVEIEISNKPSESYEKTLLAYRADKRLFKKVIWVCKNAGPANKLAKIAENIGLKQEGRIDIVPVFTESGVFKEKDLWVI